MTAGEFKFALAVERVLNCIPQPEYRQLVVETLMVLCLIIEHDNGSTQWNETIEVERLVHTANDIFVQEQVYMKTFEENMRSQSLWLLPWYLEYLVKRSLVCFKWLMKNFVQETSPGYKILMNFKSPSGRHLPMKCTLWYFETLVKSEYLSSPLRL